MGYSLTAKAEEDVVAILIQGAREFGVDQAQT